MRPCRFALFSFSWRERQKNCSLFFWTVGAKVGHGMQAPAVDELKQVFTKYAPEYLTDRSKAAAAYQQQGHGQGPGMGRFISAHLPGD